MENKLQRTTDQSLTTTNSPSLQITLQVLADPKRFNEFLATVPVKLEQVIEKPPISQLVRSGLPIATAEALVAIEIAKASNLLTVGGNLRQGQSLEIAKQLIAAYPHESIEDFCYCLRQGIRGKYNEPGKLFRFDVVVINEWFAQYLEEKSQAHEDKLMKEKDTMYQRGKRSESDWLQLLQEAVAKTDQEGKTETTPLRKTFMQDVRSLTDKEIQKEGQEKPKAKPYPSMSASEVQKFYLHRQWIAENYDPRTGDPLPGFISESDWLKLNT